MKLDEFGAEPEPLTADQLADSIGLPRRPHPLATKATRHLNPAGTPLRAKPKARPKAKPKLSAPPPFLPATPNNLPTFKTVAARHSEALARYDLTHSRHEGKRMSTLSTAQPETLAAYVERGGTGQVNLGLDAHQRLIVDTPSAAVSGAEVLADWLQTQGHPVMRRLQVIEVSTATGLVYSANEVEGEFLVDGAGSSAAADPDLTFRELKPRHVGSVPILVTRNVLAAAPDAAAWLTMGIRESIRRTVLKSIFTGSGAAGHPTGIFHTTGVEEVASPGALSALNFNKVEALKKLAAENQTEDAPGDLFALSTAVASKLAGTPKQNNNAPRLLERGRPGPGDAPYSEVPGLGEAVRLDDMPVNTAVYGDFGQIALGVWGGIQADENALFVSINPFSDDPNVKMTAYFSYDIAILRPGRFGIATYT